MPCEDCERVKATAQAEIARLTTALSAIKDMKQDDIRTQIETGDPLRMLGAMAKMIGDQGQEIATLKELKDSAKWRMEQLATYTLEQGKLVLSLQAKLGNTERDHQQAIYALGQSEDAYLKLETQVNELKAEVTSLRAKLDGEPCNLDFQREAAKMSAYADKCLTIKEEAMGHAAAMSNDVTALGEKTELLLDELQRVEKALHTYQKLYADQYMEVEKKNERITSLQEQIIEVGLANKVLLNSQYGALGAPGYPEGDEWP